MDLFWLIVGSIVAVFACADGKVIGNSKPLVDGRIYNGEDARIEDFPYQVLIATEKILVDKELIVQTQCGGSIIHPKVILTAAHCTEVILLDGYKAKFVPEDVTVRAGSSYAKYGGEIRKVAKIIVHEKYFHIKVPKHGDVVDNDIALLILADKFDLSDKIKTIKLASESDQLAPGEELITTGWGYNYSVTTLPNVLQKTKLPIIGDFYCRLEAAFPEHVLCAGFVERGNSQTCEGDSGGPFVKNDTVYGIVSSSYGNCKGSPALGLFTSVPVYREWIDKKLKSELN